MSMSPNEVAALIGYAAALDPRCGRNDAEARKLQVMAWSKHLARVASIEDAKAAVDAYYETPGQPAIMPADVLRGVRSIRTARMGVALPTPPADLDPDDTASYLRWLRSAVREAGDGKPAPAVEPGRRRPVAELLAGARWATPDRSDVA